ncbi:hypothetical protein D3C85_1198660 [compost metagenome]
MLSVDVVRNDQGEVTAIDVTEQGRRYRCERVDASNEVDNAVTRFAGRWHSEEIGGDIVIGEGRPDSMRVAGLYGRNTYRLKPLLANTCLMMSEDPVIPMHGTLRLITGKDGRRELLLDTARTRQLRFTGDAVHG